MIRQSTDKVEPQTPEQREIVQLKAQIAALRYQDMRTQRLRDVLSKENGMLWEALKEVAPDQVEIGPRGYQWLGSEAVEAWEPKRPVITDPEPLRPSKPELGLPKAPKPEPQRPMAEPGENPKMRSSPVPCFGCKRRWTEPTRRGKMNIRCPECR